MYSKVCDLEEAEMRLCEEFKNALQEWEIISPPAIGQAHDRWQFEVSSALRELSVVYWSLEKSQQDAVYRYVNCDCVTLCKFQLFLGQNFQFLSMQVRIQDGKFVEEVVRDRNVDIGGCVRASGSGTQEIVERHEGEVQITRGGEK